MFSFILTQVSVQLFVEIKATCRTCLHNIFRVDKGAELISGNMKFLVWKTRSAHRLHSKCWMDCNDMWHRDRIYCENVKGHRTFCLMSSHRWLSCIFLTRFYTINVNVKGVWLKSDLFDTLNTHTVASHDVHQSISGGRVYFKTSWWNSKPAATLVQQDWWHSRTDKTGYLSPSGLWLS